MKCKDHGLYAETVCSWCASPICSECIAMAGGKKYCMRCSDKLRVKKVIPREPEEFKNEMSFIQRRKITNVDPGLSHERLQEAKKWIAREAEQDEKKKR